MKLLQHRSPDRPAPANEKNETSEFSDVISPDHLSEGSEYMDDAIRMADQPLKTRQQSSED